VTVLAIARLRREISAASVAVFEDEARDALAPKVPKGCDHLGPATSVVVIAGQDRPVMSCPSCAYRNFRAMAESPCRVCGAADGVMLVGASFLANRRCRKPDGTTVWVEQIIVMARLCGHHRRRTPVPAAPAEGMWRGERL
jgi:hypothetical protein